MATVSFKGAYIHDGADLSSYLYFADVDVRAEHSKPGKVERYAGGRLRAVTGEAEPQSAELTLGSVTTAQRETLEGWIGDLVMYRDGRGRMFYGVYFAVAVKEIPGAAERCEVRLVIDKVTKSIEV